MRAREKFPCVGGKIRTRAGAFFLTSRARVWYTRPMGSVSIGTMIFWIVWLAVGFGVVVICTAFLLPRIMLKMHAATIPARDRAAGRLADEHGAVMLYEPAPSVRQYIKSYRIAKDGAGLYFCGEWSRLIAFVKYELVVYNASNSIVNILRVKEKFNDGETTHVTRLPKNTDYVSLRILCVDDTPVRKERTPFNVRYALWLALLSVAVALLADLLIWLGVTAYLRYLDGFTATIGIPLEIWAELLGFAALGAVVFTLTVALARFFFMRKGGKP